MTKWAILVGQFKGAVILILLFATGLSAVLKDWVDSLIILIIVFASALLGFFQEHSAQAATAHMPVDFGSTFYGRYSERLHP